MANSIDTPLVELKKIQQTFTLTSGQKIKVLENIDLSLYPNEILAILGPSGSGKSTTIRILAGLLKPTHGKVTVRGEPLEGPNREVSMVFQNFALLPWLDVGENVALGLEPLKLPHEETHQRVKKVIDLVGLEGFEEAYPRELSGGMKQRVGIARALVMERPILCLDEPFSALDVLTAETLRKELLQLWISKRTSLKSMILITHNVLEAASLGSRILVLGSNPGQIKLSIKNDLAYPRDEKSGAFRTLVENIHDVITESIIPDTPDWVPPALSASTVESIPPVQLVEVVGLLQMVRENGGRADAFALAQKLVRDSIHILLMAKAAELLDLVDTPKNAIVLTDLGKRFVAADVNERKKIINEQLRLLKITQFLKEKLEAQEDYSISLDDGILAMQEWLPNESAKEVLDTLIQWGRYGELFGYNDDTKTIYLDRGQ